MKLELSRFQEAIKAHSGELSTGTFWRYANGWLPAFGRFIVERPELAKALADDAADLAARREEDRAIVAQERG